MAVWAAEALRGVDLGDARAERRLVKLVGQLADQPERSVPAACGSWADTKAAYRFWDNDAVEPTAIREALARATAERCAGLACVLVVQDTTLLDFSSHTATRGLGQIGDDRGRGLLCHTGLAVGVNGDALGVIEQVVWAREEDAPGHQSRRSRATAEKESQRWLDTEQVTLGRLPDVPRVVTICDREADIFDLFDQPRREGAELLVRAAQTHRRVAKEGEVGPLAKQVRDEPYLYRERVSVRRNKGRTERSADLEVRAVAVELQPPVEPRARARRASQEPVRVWAVLAEEVDPPESLPKNEKPVSWLLLTTLDPEALGLDEAAAARQVVEWYRRRWLVERYHYVLKSGCGYQRLQLRTAERLERALATYAAVAWGVLWLTLLARSEPSAPASRVLTRDEWQALWAHTEPDRPPPSEPPPLREAVRRVAQLGGFLGRKGDGEPGPKTVWIGLMRLHDIAIGWALAGRSP